MEHRVEITLQVPAHRVWDVLAALRSWPEWTPTVEWIRTDTERPRVGDEVTLKQPGRGPVRYRVYAVDEGRRFLWGNDRPGMRQRADHVITPVTEASCTVMLMFAMTGPLGAVLGVLAGRKIRGMVDAEAAALRTAVAPDAGPPA